MTFTHKANDCPSVKNVLREVSKKRKGSQRRKGLENAGSV